MKNWECSLKNQIIEFCSIMPGETQFPCRGLSLCLWQFTHIPHSSEQPSTLHCFQSPGEFPPAFHENKRLSSSSEDSRGRSVNKLGLSRLRPLRSWASVNMQQNKAGTENRGHVVYHTLGVGVRKGDAGRFIKWGSFFFFCDLRVKGGRNSEHLEFSFRETFSVISEPHKDIE